MTAHILPLEAYISDAWFQREQVAIFSNLWRYAGFKEDLGAPGQFITVQVGLHNICVLMNGDGELRAFHNFCRHRGTRLLAEKGTLGSTITCPYHSWTYNLDGALIALPGESEEFPGLDKSCLGLKPASVAIWRGMIFVHPDANAPSIDGWFGEIEPYLGPHDIDALVEYEDARTVQEIKANWKIVVENYIDQYHLAHLHKHTLAMYDHAAAEFGFKGPHYAFREPLAAEYATDIANNAAMPLILPTDQLAAYVPMLFPGLGLAETETDWSIFHITPLAPDLTRVETRTRVKDVSSWEFTKQEWRSYGFWSQRSSARHGQGHEDEKLMSGDFMSEDVYVCEQIQKSLQSPGFEFGPLAERGERPVHDHQRIVLDYVEGRAKS